MPPKIQHWLSLGVQGQSRKFPTLSHRFQGQSRNLRTLSPGLQGQSTEVRPLSSGCQAPLTSYLRPWCPSQLQWHESGKQPPEHQTSTQLQEPKAHLQLHSQPVPPRIEHLQCPHTLRKATPPLPQPEQSQTYLAYLSLKHFLKQLSRRRAIRSIRFDMIYSFPLLNYECSSGRPVLALINRTQNPNILGAAFSFSQHRVRSKYSTGCRSTPPGRLSSSCADRARSTPSLLRSNRDGWSGGVSSSLFHVFGTKRL